MLTDTVSSRVSSCLAVLTLISISSSTIATLTGTSSCQEFYDPVYCHINSSNCTVYVNQTLTFVCKCVHKNCSVRWELNGNSVNGSVEYTVNVTDDIAGVMTCYNDHSPDSYQWNVTVLQPKPPKFMETPVNHYFTSERVDIGNPDGGNPTCYICVNCTVTGAPPPDVTWEYKRGSMSDFSSIVINQSNASSPYFALDNGQKLCYNDIRNYHLIDNTNYRCTAANVGGSTYGIFNALVSVYPLPQPGPSATKGPVVMTEQSATLTMDTTYQQESPYLQVCSLTTNICCHCQGTDASNCEFGKLSSSTDNGGDYTSCQLTTSKPDQYQFQVYTYNYPCFYDIGDPIDVVNDSPSSSHDHISPFVISGCLAGLLFVLLAVAYLVHQCRKHQHQQHQRRYARLGGIHHDADNDADNKVTKPLLPKTKAACKDLVCCKKKVYLAHGEDSKQWVTDRLIPLLKSFNVEVVTIDDAIPGKTYLSARADFIKEACKIIVVLSEQSVQDKPFLHDISKAQHKDPDPRKILIIPVLFGNVTHDDVPTSIKELVPISYNDREFVTKIKQSVDS